MTCAAPSSSFQIGLGSSSTGESARTVEAFEVATVRTKILMLFLVLVLAPAQALKSPQQAPISLMPETPVPANSSLKAGHSNMTQPHYGRFLVRDPIRHGGGNNLYSYAGNNPINFRDPLGLFIEATYEVTSGTLTLRDTDTDQVYEFQAFSGNGEANIDNPDREHVKDVGPIPRGDYLVGPVLDVAKYRPTLTGDTEWLPILNSSTFENVHFVNGPEGEVVKRTEFYIHPGLVSSGCITCRSETTPKDAEYPTSANYERIKRIFENTTKKTFKRPIGAHPTLNRPVFMEFQASGSLRVLR